MNYPKQRYAGIKPWLNKEWLYTEYVIKNRSSKSIAQEYGCNRNTIQQWLCKFKIKKDVVKRERIYFKKYQDKEYLITEYLKIKKQLKRLQKKIM